MHPNIRWLWTIPLMACLAGCQSAKPVNPQFGLQTLAFHGTLKFHKGDEVIEGDLQGRFEDPGRYEMLVTKGEGITICHLVADKEEWHIDLPQQKRSLTGHGTPGDEDLGLWVETHRMVAMAIKKAMFIEDFTEVIRGEYKSSRWFTMEMGEFRRVVGQIIATRMKLSCRGCNSHIEITITDVK